MASTAPSAMPAGISPPLKIISDTDMGGLIAILAAFSLTLILISFPIRAYVRSKTGTWKSDDYMFCAATVAAILQSGCVFYGISKGLGKSHQIIRRDEVPPLQKAVYTGDLFYIIALFLSKCSTAFLLLRLTPSRGHFYALWSTICLSAVWLVVSLVLLGFRCHTGDPWIDVFSVTQCHNLMTRWQFVAALDAITEALLFAVSVYLVWGVQMAMRSKTIVVSAFGCRLPVIALCLLRLHFLHISLISNDPTIQSTNAICATQLEIGYSILASIVPCLKTFIAPYDPAISGTAYPHSSNPSQKFKLSTFGSSTSNSNPKSPPATYTEHNRDDGLVEEGRTKTFMGRLRPEQTVYQARVISHDRRSGSRESQRMIIKKGVEWSVDYDAREVTPPERASNEYPPVPKKNDKRVSGTPSQGVGFAK